jgi:hypothetical protein
MTNQKDNKYISLGAINKNTGEYVYPSIASKNDKYICPDCYKDLIFVKGNIKIPHFRHYSDKEPCTFYNHPSESQIHKNAKMLLKKLLEEKRIENVIRSCNTCTNIIQTDINLNYSKVKCEYKFDYCNKIKIADVACLNDNKLNYIFEIYNTHKTKEEDRPEPWYEIDANDFMNNFNNINEPSSKISLKCIRDNCYNCLKNNNEQLKLKIAELNHINGDYVKLKKDFNDNTNSIENINNKYKKLENDFNNLICNFNILENDKSIQQDKNTTLYNICLKLNTEIEYLKNIKSNKDLINEIYILKDKIIKLQNESYNLKQIDTLNNEIKLLKEINKSYKDTEIFSKYNIMKEKYQEISSLNNSLIEDINKLNQDNHILFQKYDSIKNNKNIFLNIENYSIKQIKQISKELNISCYSKINNNNINEYIKEIKNKITLLLSFDI